MKLFLVAVALAAVASCAYGDDAYERKQPEGYFQYANVPGEHEYEVGYNRGNPSHYTSKFEQVKDWKFRTKVKWGDSYDGYGEHYWEYNHGHHEPTYEKPAYEKPAHEKPAYDKPAYEKPADYPAYSPSKY